MTSRGSSFPQGFEMPGCRSGPPPIQKETVGSTLTDRPDEQFTEITLAVPLESIHCSITT